jgi:predicted peptidase
MTHLWYPGAPAQIIVDRKDVQSELKLTAAQTSAIAAIAKANAKTFMEKVDENWQQFAKVLSYEQRVRTQQLAFQATGVASALIPGLREQLSLTKEQSKKLGELVHSYLLNEDKELMQAQNGDAPVSADEAKAARALHQQMILDAINHVLTSSQLAKVKVLQGPEFKFDDPAPRPLSTWIRAMGLNG